MRSAVNPAKLNNANKLILVLDKQWAGCALMWKWTLLPDSGALQHSGSHSSSIQNYWQDCNEKALCETGCSDTDRTVINSDLLTAAGYKTAQRLAARANKDAIISRSACIHATYALTHITNTEMMDGWEVINIQSRTAGMSHPPLARCDSNFSLSVPFFFFCLVLSHIQCKLFHSPPFSCSPCSSLTLKDANPAPQIPQPLSSALYATLSLADILKTLTWSLKTIPAIVHSCVSCTREK